MKAHLPLLLIAAVCGAVGTASLEADELGRSPFLPPDARIGASVADSSPMELRGIMSAPDGIQYCLFDRSQKRSFWVRPNQANGEFVILAADASAQTVEVKMSSGQVLHLKMQEAKIALDRTRSWPVALAAAAAPAPSASPEGSDESQSGSEAETRAEWNAEFRRRQAENAASR